MTFFSTSLRLIMNNDARYLRKCGNHFVDAATTLWCLSQTLNLNALIVNKFLFHYLHYAGIKPLSMATDQDHCDPFNLLTLVRACPHAIDVVNGSLHGHDYNIMFNLFVMQRSRIPLTRVKKSNIDCVSKNFFSMQAVSKCRHCHNGRISWRTFTPDAVFVNTFVLQPEDY